MKMLPRIFAGIMVLAAFYIIFAVSTAQKNTPPKKTFKSPQMQTLNEIKDEGQFEIATFAGGCFWCMEPAYQEHPGVIDAVVGYSGGAEEDANYEQVGSGKTKHREVVQVTYDPMIVDYETLLEIFWRQIDPTDSGGQFADRGYQYTTAIYYHDETQKALAEKSKRQIQSSEKFSKQIVTQIEAFSNFFLAEEYHQDYYQKSSQRYKKYKKGSGREDYLEEKWEETEEIKPVEVLPENNETGLNFEDFEKPSKKELQESLTEIQYKVTQKDGTETPFDNAYWDNKEDGIYVDIVSGEPLYSSTHKYKSGTGWPSFWQPIDEKYIVKKKDWKLIYPRTEIRSKYGDNHIGHVFSDGPEPTGLRYCMNSAAMRFIPRELMESEGYGVYLDLFD